VGANPGIHLLQRLQLVGVLQQRDQAQIDHARHCASVYVRVCGGGEGVRTNRATRRQGAWLVS
jgi:hypothetical protein